MTLAESTGNLLFSGIISALRQVIQEHMSSLDETTVSNSLQQHKEILQAVRAVSYTHLLSAYSAYAYHLACYAVYRL